MVDAGWDVFVSYARDDENAARNLGSRLNAMGLRAFVAASDLPVGVKFQDYMEKALGEAEVVVALCSTESAASVWAHSEIALAADLALSGKIALVPVFLDADAAAQASPVLKHFVGTSTVNGWDSVARDVFDVVKRAQSSRENGLSSRWRVPSGPRDLLPTGDLVAVQAAATRCREDRITTLQVVGRPGVGKTTAVAEFARTATSYGQTIWVPSTGTQVTAVLEDLVAELGVQEGDILQRTWRYVRRALDLSTAVLFVVDEVEPGDEIQPLVDALEPWDLLITTSRTANSDLEGVTVELAGLGTGEVSDIIERWAQSVIASSDELGRWHPSTLSAMSALAALLMGTGRTVEATEVLEELVQASTATVGPEHPTALAARSNLAAAYHQLGRIHESLDLLVRLADDSTTALGERHPTTLAVLANIDTLRDGQG